MIVCVPVTPTGGIDSSWGRAPRVAVGELRDGVLAGWDEYDVGWDASHDVGSEGSHHARVARFLQERSVDVVLAHHMGPPMVQMLRSMGVDVRLGASGDARQAVLDLVPGGPA
jgi:predicted Fe-Mo cluster-binding NifX family protein